MKNLKNYYIKVWKNNKAGELYKRFDDRDNLVSKFNSERSFITEIENDGYRISKKSIGHWKDADLSELSFWRADKAPSDVFNKMRKAEWNELHKEIS